MLRPSLFTESATDLSMCIGGTVVACLVLMETQTRGQATGDMPYVVKNINALVHPIPPDSCRSADSRTFEHTMASTVRSCGVRTEPRKGRRW
jgi:hypothetical protein